MNPPSSAFQLGSTIAGQLSTGYGARALGRPSDASSCAKKQHTGPSDKEAKNVATSCEHKESRVDIDVGSLHGR